MRESPTYSEKILAIFIILLSMGWWEVNPFITIGCITIGLHAYFRKLIVEKSSRLNQK